MAKFLRKRLSQRPSRFIEYVTKRNSSKFLPYYGLSIGLIVALCYYLLPIFLHFIQFIFEWFEITIEDVLEILFGLPKRITEILIISTLVLSGILVTWRILFTFYTSLSPLYRSTLDSLSTANAPLCSYKEDQVVKNVSQAQCDFFAVNLNEQHLFQEGHLHNSMTNGLLYVSIKKENNN